MNATSARVSRCGRRLESPTGYIRILVVADGSRPLGGMGGVTHEIDLLRRASPACFDRLKGDRDRAIYDARPGLCEDLNVDIRVDITTLVSAASARRRRSNSHSGKYAPSRSFGTATSNVPIRVSRSR